MMRLETEQMAAIADHRQGSTRRTSMNIEHTASCKVGHPAPSDALRDFLAMIPADATISISQHEGGHQRDPIVTGYTLYAKWTTT